jgi:PIN domain nuclease of toxin-antitoxin system
VGKLPSRVGGLTSVIADTQSVVWLFAEPERLSSPALQAFRGAQAAGDPIVISAITIVEIIYLTEKGRLDRAVLDDLRDRVADEYGTVVIAPVDDVVTGAVERVARDAVPDMPDRIIGASALALGLRLVTSDGALRDSVVPTIW